MSRDTAAAATAAFVFSIALGIASVAVPLLALHEGYDAVQVGVLAALPAATQMTTRFVLGAVMRLMSDWVLVAAAAAMLAVASMILVWSASAMPFAVAQLLQGTARACFWTGSQTHVVRGKRSSVRSLALVEFVSGAGQLTGPVLAGVLASDGTTTAMAVGAALAAASFVPTLFLDRLPPFERLTDRVRSRVWRRPTVAAGCWGAAVGGAWRGVQSSYLPVLLTQAGYASTVVGILVAVANGTSVVGSGVAGRVKGGFRSPYLAGVVLVGGTLACLALVADHPVLLGCVLGLSGLAAGVIQTIGPAIAADAVHEQERGDAIAAVGTFRAAALFVVPFGMAAMVMVTPLAVAFGVAGTLIAVPALAARNLPGRPQRT